MATFFMDPENGNDANDGTTFANRWKTIQLGATAARIAPGDTIRIMASPDPVSPGSATWTDNSGTITWSSAKNLVIDNCETNWTAATNVTCALSTTRVKQGSNGQTVTPGSAFTTGKLAHRTLPATLDLSSYEQVSLWVRYGALTNAGELELKLCSDTLGDTAVNTLALPAGVNGQWRCVVLNNAAALGASIASIALYATVDPGTTAMYLDNIVGCKAASAADCVTHEHVIGKKTAGEPEWYSILSIGDSSVIIGGAHNVEIGTTTGPRPYRGTTEAVVTYVQKGFPAWTTSQRSVQDSGDATSGYITFSGGWNRTDMTTQTGVSYFNGAHMESAALVISGRSYLDISKIGGFNFTTAVVTNATAIHTIKLDVEQAVGCTSGMLSASGTVSRYMKLKFDTINGMTSSTGFIGCGDAATGRMDVVGRRLHAQCSSSAAIALTMYGGMRYAIDKIDNNPGYGASQLNLDSGQTVTLIGTTFANNAVGDFAQDGTGEVLTYGCTFATPTFTSYDTKIKSTRHGGVATDHRIYTREYKIASATDQRHTASGISWKVSPLQAANCISEYPALTPLGKLAVNASALVTVKCWVRRDNTGISAGLRIFGNAIPGVGADDIQTLMTAAIDTWEEITLTFTPTVAGVVDVYGVAWGGSTLNAWFDDLTFTQA